MRLTQETNLNLTLLKQIGIWIVAFYLIGAASLKVFGGGQEVKVFSPLVISLATLVEFFVGILLLTNLTKKLIWIVSVSLFLSLFLVSANTALSGFSDCGCFGPLKINPWMTTFFNGIAIIILLFANPIGSPRVIISEIFISIAL